MPKPVEIPNASVSAKESQWRKDVPDFLFSLWKHWEVLVVSILGSSLLIILQERGIMTTIPSTVIWLVAMSGIIIASFKTWRDQKRITELKEDELQNLKSKNAEIERKQDIKAKLTNLLSGLSRRIREIKKIDPLFYELTMGEVDTETEKAISNVGKALEAAYGKAEAKLFINTTGFPKRMSISEHDKYDAMIYLLEQYSLRLREMIENL